MFSGKVWVLWHRNWSLDWSSRNGENERLRTKFFKEIARLFKSGGNWGYEWFVQILEPFDGV
jgi:hypothetical protein